MTDEYYHLNDMPDGECIVKFKENTCGACHHLIFKDHRHREGLCNLCRLHRCFDDRCVHEEENVMNNSTNPFRCEYCGRFIELSNMVQITVTRNPLEDSNVISKSHVFCQDCWNTSQIFIRGKEIT